MTEKIRPTFTDQLLIENIPAEIVEKYKLCAENGKLLIGNEVLKLQSGKTISVEDHSVYIGLITEINISSSAVTLQLDNISYKRIVFYKNMDKICFHL